MKHARTRSHYLTMQYVTFFGALAKASMYQVHGSANLNVLLQPSFMWIGENKCSQTHMLHNVPQNAARQLI